MKMSWSTLVMGALYVSEIWYAKFAEKGCVYSKARAMVSHDRVITQREFKNPLPIDYRA